MAKNFNSLVTDIYSYVSGKGQYPLPTEGDFKELSDILAKMCVNRFTERMEQQSEEPKFKLRMSNYGLGNRRLWYENKYPSNTKYKDSDLLKFLIGDICEAVLLFIATKTGHKVEHLQKTVMFEGVEGHLDAVIDDVLMDAKSASKYSFNKKFLDAGILNESDDFAYIPQIKGYEAALEEEGVKIKETAFLAQNKETGELCQLTIPKSVGYNVKQKIADVRECFDKPNPPTEKCYPDQEDGEQGNRILSANCGFCRFKKMCWADSNYGYGLRAFKYSNGTKYFTQINKLPRVEEIEIE